MNDREKLIRMIAHKQDCGLTHTTSGASIASYNEDLADHLLANGVTFAKDTNALNKWIPVSKQLPEPKLNVLAYGVSGDGEIPSVHSGYTRGIDEGWFTWEDSKLISNVTHWMSLPAAPKKEE